MRALFLCFLILIVSPLAHGLSVPEFSSNVYDSTGTLSEDDRARISSAIEELRKSAHIWAAVAVIPNLEDETIEGASQKFFDKWELGQKGIDNGLLILVTMHERKMRIQTGYGLEGDLPDVVCARVVDNVMRPEFRAKRYADGLIQALMTLKDIRLHVMDPNELGHADSEPVDLSWSRFALGMCFNFAPFFLLIGLGITRRTIQKWPVEFRHFRGMDWGTSFVLFLFMGLFLGFFWSVVNPRDLWFMGFFNAPFTAIASIPLADIFQLLRNKKRIEEKKYQWDLYDLGVEDYWERKAKAEAAGTEKEFLYRTRKPAPPIAGFYNESLSPEEIEKAEAVKAAARKKEKERRAKLGFFGRMKEDFRNSGSGSSSWGSSGSSSSSRSSSWSSSSSSSGGGRSGGGGASGSW